MTEFKVGANVALVCVLFNGSMLFDEYLIAGLDKLHGARIRLRGAVAATITKIDARQRNNPPGGVARMEADFRESEHLLQANCFSAALPGAHALGRVRSPQIRLIATWPVETEMLPEQSNTSLGNNGGANRAEMVRRIFQKYFHKIEDSSGSNRWISLRIVLDGVKGDSLRS